jgi:hypothetical protein
MTTTPPPDYSLLDPGIRRLIRWLRSKGYETTDSGDGTTKLGDPDALDFPHVFILSARARLAAEADDLLADLATIGIVVAPQSEEGEGASIQAMYDPADGTAVLGLFWVTDKDMPPLAN